VVEDATGFGADVVVAACSPPSERSPGRNAPAANSAMTKALASAATLRLRRRRDKEGASGMHAVIASETGTRILRGSARRIRTRVAEMDGSTPVAAT
jgi:hypothetical protein